ncbi:MAG TPA: GTPase ObgE [bacterium]|nr:GTPase ObgE [bacterium]
MKFIDEATIDVIAGDGGNGCVSFRREKYVPKGGPNGGDGGDGGSVIFRVDGGLSTLLDVQYHHNYKAGRGEHGKGKQMYGRGGKNAIVRVPAGTMVYDAESGRLLADLSEAGTDWVAAAGGRGGLGNMHFVSSTNQAPRKATQGTPGERRRLRLELKLLADVGLVGCPNAGKSTLVSAVSNARPKVADYPFTTKVPCLGLVKLRDGKSFVVADIPGLIEGAHDGAGMGMQFLRHIERTRIILHLVDVTDPARPDPVESYRAIRGELASYDKRLAKRPEIVVLTKMDLPEAKGRAVETAKAIKKISRRPVISISAAARKGIAELMVEIEKLLQA